MNVCKIIMITKMKLLFSIILFLTFNIHLKAQSIPESVEIDVQKILLQGVRPRTAPKDALDAAEQIKWQTNQRATSMGLESFKALLGTPLRNYGYSSRSIEYILEDFGDNDMKGIVGGIMRLSNDDVLLWSGYSNPFVDNYSNAGPLDYGIHHPNFDRSKIFWTDSEFEGNDMRNLNTPLKYDYILSVRVDVDGGIMPSQRFDIHVNSKDGSVGFEGQQAAQLIGMPNEAASKVHFVAVSRKGKGMSFMQEEDGLAANLIDGKPMILTALDGKGNHDKDAELNERFVQNMASMRQISRVRGMPGHYGTQYKCVEGRYNDRHNTILCFKQGSSNIKTLIPFLGIGVGVFKDYVNEENKLVIRRKGIGLYGVGFEITLLDFKQQNFTFISSRYTSTGNNYHDTQRSRQAEKTVKDQIARVRARMAALESRLERSLEQLKEQRRTCPTTECKSNVDDMVKRARRQARDARRPLESQLDDLKQRLRRIKKVGE